MVKFDLKAFYHGLHAALTGTDNVRVRENFRQLGRCIPEVLTATTLLVPFYIDAAEVRSTFRFIAGISPDIPYSLLVFYPDFALLDLPLTPLAQVRGLHETRRTGGSPIGLLKKIY